MAKCKRSPEGIFVGHIFHSVNYNQKLSFLEKKYCMLFFPVSTPNIIPISWLYLKYVCISSKYPISLSSYQSEFPIYLMNFKDIDVAIWSYVQQIFWIRRKWMLQPHKPSPKSPYMGGINRPQTVSLLLGVQHCSKFVRRSWEKTYTFNQFWKYIYMYIYICICILYVYIYMCVFTICH